MKANSRPGNSRTGIPGGLASGRPFIPVFFHTKYYHDIPTGTYLSGASTAGGYEKITIFDQYLALSRKQYRTGPLLL